MTRSTLALLSALALSPALAQEVAPPAGAQPAPQAASPEGAPATPAPEPQRPGARVIPRGAVLEEVSGTLKAIDRATHRLTVETAAGPVSLGVDRNTMVYTGAGLGTVRDLVPGTQLRAGRNAEFLAYWVQVRPVTGAPTSTPAQGTGPGGGAGPPPEGGSPSPTGGSAGPGTSGPPGGGAVSPGPPSGSTTTPGG